MSSYIGKIQVDQGTQVPIGSTLHGICDTEATTAAKVVTLADFDALMKGITVHVRFSAGNSVTSGLTLQVGSTIAYPINGNCVCNADDVIAFTYWEDSSSHVWYANTNIVAAEGTANGQIKINGQDVNVHGLGTAAYTDSSTYAPIASPTFTGVVTVPAVDDTTATGAAATVDYVRQKTAGLSGLTGAMHFKGSTSTTMTDGRTTATVVINGTNYTPEAGDVVLSDTHQEYVWVETNATTHEGYWELLGDEGSYVLATSQTTGSVGSASGWSAGSASSATVSGGILQLTNSTVPTLTVTSTTVVMPATIS